MDWATLGLLIIALAWLVQMVFYYKGKKEIKKEFVGLYMLGVVFLLINYWVTSGIIHPFELLTLLLSGAIFFKGCCKKKMSAPKAKKRRR